MHGRPADGARTGDAVTLRFHFSLPAPLAAPVLVASFHTLDGLEVSRPAVPMTDLFAGVVPTTGAVDLDIARLPVLGGTYDITAAIAEGGVLHGVPDRAHALRIVVERGLRGRGARCGLPRWSVEARGTRGGDVSRRATAADVRADVGVVSVVLAVDADLTAAAPHGRRGAWARHHGDSRSSSWWRARPRRGGPRRARARRAGRRRGSGRWGGPVPQRGRTCARGEHVAFLAAGAEPERGWITEALAALQRDARQVSSRAGSSTARPWCSQERGCRCAATRCRSTRGVRRASCRASMPRTCSRPPRRSSSARARSRSSGASTRRSVRRSPRPISGGACACRASEWCRRRARVCRSPTCRRCPPTPMTMPWRCS